jgi:hypothetical protein
MGLKTLGRITGLVKTLRKTWQKYRVSQDFSQSFVCTFRNFGYGAKILYPVLRLVSLRFMISNWANIEQVQKNPFFFSPLYQ